jgi:hypothetical protein
MRFILMSLLLASATVNASPVVLDFDDLPYGVFDVPLVHKGFVIDPALSPTGPSVDGYAIDKEIGFCGYCVDGAEGISIYSYQGISFELDSMNISSLGTTFTGTVTGYFDAGGSITQAITNFGAADFVLVEISFDSLWRNLASIDIEFDTYTTNPNSVPAVDDIVLQVVPVPAAVWLFGSALVGLGFMRRRVVAQ